MSLVVKRVPRELSESKKSEFRASLGAVAYCKEPSLCLNRLDGVIRTQNKQTSKHNRDNYKKDRKNPVFK